MKFIKDLNENFSLVNLLNQKDTGYLEKVKDRCFSIAQNELGVGEKWFSGLDRLDGIVLNIIERNKHEFESIASNCKQRNMRPEYAAEVAYHTFMQDRLNGLKDKSWAMGGFKQPSE